MGLRGGGGGRIQNAHSNADYVDQGEASKKDAKGKAGEFGMKFSPKRKKPARKKRGKDPAQPRIAKASTGY